jgi:hypothetical protein
MAHPVVANAGASADRRQRAINARRFAESGRDRVAASRVAAGPRHDCFDAFPNAKSGRAGNRYSGGA